MGMIDLEKALDEIRASDDAHFIGPHDPPVVAAAEEALGVSFPPTYRRFVTELGAGGVTGLELYGVTSGDFDAAGVPNGIWLTLDERKRFGLPHHLVMIADGGLRDWYVLDTARRDEDGECPVALWVPGESYVDDLEVVAPDFGSFFRQQLREVRGWTGA